MAASTITRDTWTNDTGTAAAPNLDGTVINNAALQNNVYARIDELFSGAGSYTTLTLGGSLSVEAGKITFPATQSASAGANVLDDYEEGSWTPTITATGGASGQSYTTQTGRYNKIGNKVTCWFTVILAGKGTLTSAIQIGGLPFTSENTAGLQGALDVPYWENLATAFVKLGGLVQANTSAATIYAITAAATSMATIATADMGNTTGFIGMITYRAVN
jgi:hypothetical protein